jgi:hypothetical protein
LATPSSAELRASAEQRFKKKEEQFREGQKAMAEYVAAGVAEREKTARLRALREAKEAAKVNAKVNLSGVEASATLNRARKSTRRT